MILNLARSQSKLYQIERMTWFRSLEDFDRFREKTGDRRLFVNSISNQILTPEDVAAFEEEYGKYLHRLVVELTEEDKPDEEMARRKKLICRRWDAQMALDDYGTGYNSEFTLLSLNPDYLKIDMSIVRNIDRDANRQMILQNTLHYARSQGILLIAEGVETWDEMEYLILQRRPLSARVLHRSASSYARRTRRPCPGGNPADRLRNGAVTEQRFDRAPKRGRKQGLQSPAKV